MNTSSLKVLLLASLTALGAVAARAGDGPAETAAPVAAGQGLLGQVYGTLTYGYVDLDASDVHADNFRFELNQPLAFGLDGYLAYDLTRSGVFANGTRLRVQTLGGGLRAFSTQFNWGKPFVDVGAGAAWAKANGASDNSFFWTVAAGAELQVAPKTTVTPYAKFTDLPDLGGGSRWNFGVKASHWVDEQWAVTAGVELGDDHNTKWTVGTNFRF